MHDHTRLERSGEKKESYDTRVKPSLFCRFVYACPSGQFNASVRHSSSSPSSLSSPSSPPPPSYQIVHIQKPNQNQRVKETKGHSPPILGNIRRDRIVAWRNLPCLARRRYGFREAPAIRVLYDIALDLLRSGGKAEAIPSLAHRLPLFGRHRTVRLSNPRAAKGAATPVTRRLGMGRGTVARGGRVMRTRCRRGRNSCEYVPAKERLAFTVLSHAAVGTECG